MTKALLKRTLSVANELIRRDTGVSLIFYLGAEDYEKYRIIMASFGLIESGGSGQKVSLGYRKGIGSNYITILKKGEPI